jgi:hypothetical protein
MHGAKLFVTIHHPSAIDFYFPEFHEALDILIPF